MKPDLLHSLFHDGQTYGSVRIRKSKLPWMLGRVLETPTVWDMLMREWAEFGQTRPLHGFQHGDEITLASAAGEDIGARWTARREPPRRAAVPLLARLDDEPAASHAA